METNYLPDPGRFRPLSPVAYIAFGLLFMLPVVGLLCAILFAFLAKNVNLRIFARACILWHAIAVTAVAAFAAVLYSKGRLFKFLRNIPKAYRVLYPW